MKLSSSNDSFTLWCTVFIFAQAAQGLCTLTGRGAVCGTAGAGSTPAKGLFLLLIFYG